MDTLYCKHLYYLWIWIYVVRIFLYSLISYTIRIHVNSLFFSLQFEPRQNEKYRLSVFAYSFAGWGVSHILSQLNNWLKSVEVRSQLNRVKSGDVVSVGISSVHEVLKSVARMKASHNNFWIAHIHVFATLTSDAKFDNLFPSCGYCKSSSSFNIFS